MSFNLIDIQTILIAIIISMSCGVLGIFLVLRKMSMMIDAISHTILLGVVVSYSLTRNLSSPFIAIGATLVGLVTVFLIESLVNTKRIDAETATGVVFPFLFSIAVIIITTKYRNTHLDTHAISGNLEFAAFDQFKLFGLNIGSKVMYTSLLILIIIIIFVKIFFKELKIITFDKILATSIGISVTLIHYLLMSLISLTAVTSLSSVGVIMVVAMMIGPAASALLFSKDLKKAIIASMIIAAFNAILGYSVAMYALRGNVNLASTIASVTLFTFLAILTFEPKNGLIISLIRKGNKKDEFSFATLIIHIGNHQNTKAAEKELNIKNVMKELKWSKEKTDKYIKRGTISGMIDLNNMTMSLSKIGMKYYIRKVNELFKED